MEAQRPEPGKKIDPRGAAWLKATGHPAAAWFNEDGTPRNSITCVICSQQVDCDDDFAVADHMREHLTGLGKLEPTGSYRRGIIVGAGVAITVLNLIWFMTMVLR